MKTLPALTLIAAVAAFALFPYNLPLAATLLFGTSLVSIFASDYGRALKPLTASAKVVEFPRPARPAPAFGLAA